MDLVLKGINADDIDDWMSWTPDNPEDVQQCFTMIRPVVRCCLRPE